MTRDRTTSPAPEAERAPAHRVCDILARLRETVHQSITDIERIAEIEVQRHGDDTLDGMAWCDFGDGLHSDVARAARTMEWEIAAMRGSLIYRGLMGSEHDTAPPPMSDTTA
jgi:hypothetical protein